MMKYLNGKELADYIKERQAKQVRGLRQAHGIEPKLAIIRTNPDPVVDSYMNIKQRYGNDILVKVDVHTIEQPDTLKLIDQLNKDETVHGIIVQIPLPDPSRTDEVLNAVAREKDVDGLAAETDFDAPTPTAIHWLLTGYNIELAGKQIVIAGQGRLVGRPLAKMWRASGLNVKTADAKTTNLAEMVRTADILVTATGRPGLITSDMVKENAVVVDAGVATDSNGIVGDVAADARERDDLTITPEKGGVGPLTVSALFDNVIRSARSVAEKNEKDNRSI